MLGERFYLGLLFILLSFSGASIEAAMACGSGSGSAAPFANAGRIAAARVQAQNAEKHAQLIEQMVRDMNFAAAKFGAEFALAVVPAMTAVATLNPVAAETALGLAIDAAMDLGEAAGIAAAIND